MQKILKFGGSSLANAECIKKVAEIILQESTTASVIVVVSAMQHITNQLIECATKAAANDQKYKTIYEIIIKTHEKVLNELHLNNNLTILFSELEANLHGIALLKECSARSLDTIASFGERLSAQLLTDYLTQQHPAISVDLTQQHPAMCVDARQFIVTDSHFTNANVLFNQTNTAIRNYFKNLPTQTIPVVTGFIAANEEKQTTTLGRNGSDYSAAIIGAALEVARIEIWTDVDGIYTCDPRLVQRAYVVPHISYEEAMELSHFGAKVLHSASIAPAIKQNIPIVIKNTFNPTAAGTLIDEQKDFDKKGIKGISSIADVTLMTLRGINMVGVPGTAERLFRSLARQNVNVILISQASSEHTICFAIKNTDIAAAEAALQNEFRYEVENFLIKIEKKTQQLIIAVVGDNMIGMPGVAGKFCYALGQNKININAIAQGASERNISLVIDAAYENLALNVIHQFFFETRKLLYLCLVGIGNVGGALLSFLEKQAATLLDKGYDVQVCAIANSKKCYFDPKGIDLAHWPKRLQSSTEEFSVDRLLNLIKEAHLSHVALIDCTASGDIVARYADFVKNNIHIITPNKKANVLPWKEYNALLELLELHQRYFLFEANVGAGLPIISTLQDLIIGGDEILKIEGIFSGTLSYLFNHLDEHKNFSQLLEQAASEGFTEPDPREDLSGTDVARKLLILARQLGRKMDFEEVEIENLVPPHLLKGRFTKQFYEDLKPFDKEIKKRLMHAKNNNCVLRYVGTVDQKGARAKLCEVPSDHPLALAKHTDNIVVFTTKRYAQTPLVIQGPGAGADVTAMGVFSDIFKLLHYLPY